ncbi:tRNA (adenosine(37)-N6)-threonylcarbamoyltransferase complex ATPase subunit type 1 TsaE [Helicobacter sp. 11S03491-1]|nr:tRNA (adenosine(37)-N6)-threonylcarbamoyltransferase complex ATPase subunit type 1 TsaE [Helicobacter sp. 11S03491-1]
MKKLDLVVKQIVKITQQGAKIFLLRGDLASGKTSLIKAYTAYFYPDEIVSSPTFTLMHCYGEIYHYDLYRRSLQEVLQLGLLEWLENQGVHFVEWGSQQLEKILKENGYNACVIEIIKHENNRTYRINCG